MRTIIRRIRQLESRVAAPDFGEPSPAETLWARRQRRLTASGLPCEKPLEPLCYAPGKRELIADVLRRRRPTRQAGTTPLASDNEY